MRLHVNVDHVATVRNARGTVYPDPVTAAQQCEHFGADGITMHLREDRRHIRDDDVYRAAKVLRTMLNLEMAATLEMGKIAEEVKPQVVTLVPEKREERTTEGGLDVSAAASRVKELIAQLRPLGTRISLFIEPELKVVDLCRELGVDQVEFHTGLYAELQGAAQEKELERIALAAKHAAGLQIEVAAGHGLTKHNVSALVTIPEIRELNIGHAIIADSIFLGLDRALNDFRVAMARGKLGY